MGNSLITVAGLSVLMTAVSACQTIETLPEKTQLALMQSKPVDYSRFPKRETADKQVGRGLRNSLSLADQVGEYNLIEDRVIEEDLKRRLDLLLPQDYSYKVGDKVLSEYPLDTQFHIFDKQVYDAHALPNGDIVFSNAALNETTSIDTLDWIVAHEASHQLLDHHKSREDRASRQQAISILGAVAIMAAGRSRAGNLAYGATSGALVLNQLGVSQFELKEEIQADQLAMDLMLNKKNDPRNPEKAINRLEFFRDALQGAVAKTEKMVEQGVQQYTNYCGESGLFSPLTQSQNPNSQSRLCQQWYKLGRAGIEQFYELPILKKELEETTSRVAASQQYYDRHIATLPGQLPPAVDFKDVKTGKVISYAGFVNANGPSVRTYEIRQVDALLREGRCREAIARVRGILRGPSDEDPAVREAAYRAEKRCPVEAKPYKTARVCKKEVGHFGAYEHLCISYRANRANEGMLRELQTEFEQRSLFKDALEVMLTRRSQSSTPADRFFEWLPEEIRLHRLAGDRETMNARYEECAAVEKADKDFKELCRRAAYPEEFETALPAPDQAPSATPEPSDGGLPPIITPISGELPITFDVFEEAVLRTELNELVRGDGEFVIYMPSDGALRRHIGGKDPKSLLEPANRSLLTTILSAHIVRVKPNGEKHANSPHLKSGFESADDIELILEAAGGVIHGSATYGNFTLKPVDTVIEPRMKVAP